MPLIWCMAYQTRNKQHNKQNQGPTKEKSLWTLQIICYEFMSI